MWFIIIFGTLLFPVITRELILVSIVWWCSEQHGHPYISAMVSNGSMHYDHDSDGTHTSLSGCQANIRGQSTDTYIAIRYENDTLMVRQYYRRLHLYTHTHTFNGPFSGTTQVSQYQKGKNQSGL